MTYDTTFKIGDRTIGNGSPTYFIADIGANHDGSLGRASGLIHKAAEAGADCVKFQHFKANKIVSRKGFEDLKIAHQACWEKPVYETYEQYSINREWDFILSERSKECGVDFMTTPYDLDAVDKIEHLVKAFKIGSGDITYDQFIRYIAASRKPTFMATGASNMYEVEKAVSSFLEHNRQLCLMQCNTNYTGSLENLHHVNLRVLQTYAERWPGLPLGLSDHTYGHTTALGAVALGACVIEKHFTDDITRKGPDHAFAMSPATWTVMVQLVRDLEAAMGDGIKRVEENEKESVVVQRRAIRLKRDLVEGSALSSDDVEFLRPCPDGAYTPADIDEVIDCILAHDMTAGQEIHPHDLA